MSRPSARRSGPEGTSQFDDATAVRADGPGRFTADVHPTWSVAGRTNGGYLLALAARAAVEHLAGTTPPDATSPAPHRLAASTSPAPHPLAASTPSAPHPLAATATYLSPAPAGPAVLTVQTLRAGRTTSVLRVGLASEDGEPRVEALITCGRLATDSTAHHDGVDPVRLPPLEQCVRLPVDGPGFTVPIMAVVAQHLDPACLGWATGHPSGAGELRGHLYLDDGRDADPLSLLLAVDALPPATFDLGLSGWVPTMQLSAYVRALPAPGPLVVRQRAGLVSTSDAGSGLVDETCDVWDSGGRLVATGHQLAGVRVPRPHPAS